MITQGRSKRRISGSRRRTYRKKKLYEKGSPPTLTLLGSRNVKKIRMKGGNMKIRVLLSDLVNLYNPNTKQFIKAKIKTISDNPANRNYVRRNIMTKGTIVETDQGKARITNRPGQEGAINAVLIS